ncbi:MAG: hypothetical protein WDO16_01010 [Bacteroidota bacterium]
MIFILSVVKSRKNSRAQKKIVEDICRENNIIWHPLPYTKSPPVLSTLKDVRHITKKAFELNRIHHFDMVHCRGYISSLAGFENEKKAGERLFFSICAASGQMRKWMPAAGT